MPENTVYSNPPIQEALIDIKVVYPDGFTVTALESIHQEFREDLPEKNARNSFSVVFNAEEGAATNQAEVDGFMFRSADGSRVLQLTKEGFTFSLINNYTNWAEFMNEAMNYWAKFTSFASPTAISRVGLRYINRINIPTETEDLSEYFTTQVKLGDIQNKPSELFMRAVIPHDDFTCIITEATNPSLIDAEKTGFILDIDVFTETQHNVEDEIKLTETLGKLRDIKNNTFQGSLTAKTKEMFQ